MRGQPWLTALGPDTDAFSISLFQAVLSGLLFVAMFLPNFGKNFVQCQMVKKCGSFLSIVSTACRELT